RNSGGGIFGRVSQGDPDQDTDYHTEVAVGDYDNDGRLDVLVSAGEGAPAGSPNTLYHNNGDNTFSRATNSGVASQLGYFRVNALADYDNDGFLDFFVDNHGDATDNGGRSLLFHNNGNGTFSEITSSALSDDVCVPFGVQWADYDNDGYM